MSVYKSREAGKTFLSDRSACKGAVKKSGSDFSMTQCEGFGDNHPAGRELSGSLTTSSKPGIRR